MKYIKMYENKVEKAAFKRLFDHFDMLFSQMGYDSQFVNDKIEFRKDLGYVFSFDDVISLKAYLIYDESSVNQDEISNFIVEYLKTIKGLRFNEESSGISFEIAPYLFKSRDLEINIDKVISQISLEDFKLKFSASKYNI